MLFYCNNYEFNINWEQAFSELHSKYQQLSNDYSSAIQLGNELRFKIENLNKQNEDLKGKKQLTKFHPLEKDDVSIGDSFQISEKEITIKPDKKNNSKIKSQPSGEVETKQDGHLYECTYQGCHKVYTSPVSMNLHIKMKHNGGTKKEREAYARILLEAKQRGDQPPKMNINLPPNFLEEYRTSYEYMKKYSM